MKNKVIACSLIWSILSCNIIFSELTITPPVREHIAPLVQPIVLFSAKKHDTNFLKMVTTFPYFIAESVYLTAGNDAASVYQDPQIMAAFLVLNYKKNNTKN